MFIFEESWTLGEYETNTIGSPSFGDYECLADPDGPSFGAYECGADYDYVDCD